MLVDLQLIAERFTAEIIVVAISTTVTFLRGRILTWIKKLFPSPDNWLILAKLMLILNIIAGLIAIASFVIEFSSSMEPERQPVVEITHPNYGATVEIRELIKGTSKNVPSDQAIWVVVRPHVGHNFHPQSHPAKIEVDGDWSAFAYIGRENESDKHFDVIVVLANREAQGIFNAYLEKSRKERSWPGLGEIPAGVLIFDRIKVTRR